MTNDLLARLCLSLPAAEETVKWDHLCFTIGEKIFCISGIGQGGGVSFKVSPEDFEDLTAQPGIGQAPHFARGQWVQVSPEARLSPAEWETCLRRSHELVRLKLPLGVRRLIGG